MGHVLRSQGVGFVGKPADHLPALLVQTDFHAPLSMLQSVADQIGENPQHRPGVRPHLGQPLGQLHLHVEAPVGEIVVKGRQQTGQRGVEVHLLPLEQVLSPLQP